MNELLRTLIAAVAAVSMAGCGETTTQAAVPPPADLTRDAIGYYCNMIVLDHQGPKGQIFVEGETTPRWFASVRDALAFTRLPEEPRHIAAVYVHDMGRASWERPENDTWIDAREAWYVIGSRRAGGMGAPETVPFEKRDAAEAFVREHGGQVVAFAGIPSEAVLGPVSPMPADHAPMPESASGHRGQHAGAGPARRHAHHAAGTATHSGSKP